MRRDLNYLMHNDLRLLLKSSFLARRYKGFHLLEFISLLIMQTQTITRACAACVHWNKMEDDHGECRRHAPQTVAFEVDDEVKFESMFPVTAAEDWCGDFTKAD